MMKLMAACALLAAPQMVGAQRAAPTSFAPPPAPKPVDHGPDYRAAIACPNGCISPVTMVTYASYVAPRAGIVGVVLMRVQNIGFEKGIYYLNSERDYRDRNNLTVTIREEDMRILLPDLGHHEIWPRLMGRDIYARGVARRVRIDFLNDDKKPSGKYYYQIQMRLTDASDLRLDGS